MWLKDYPIIEEAYNLVREQCDNPLGNYKYDKNKLQKSKSNLEEFVNNYKNPDMGIGKLYKKCQDIQFYTLLFIVIGRDESFWSSLNLKLKSENDKALEESKSSIINFLGEFNTFSKTLGWGELEALRSQIREEFGDSSREYKFARILQDLRELLAFDIVARVNDDKNTCLEINDLLFEKLLPLRSTHYSGGGVFDPICPVAVKISLEETKVKTKFELYTIRELTFLSNTKLKKPNNEILAGIASARFGRNVSEATVRNAWKSIKSKVSIE